MARAKRRWIPFGVHQSGPYSRLTEMQKAFYLELWMIAEQSNEIPNDLDAIRHMLGRGGQGARTKKAVESFIECGLISVAVDGRWILTEPRDLSYLGAKKKDPITTHLRSSYDPVTINLRSTYNPITTHHHEQ